ncbi:MAG: MFS transporter [Dehalococcoidia bacterium]|nr:MFS transporter [Dehalococcoidia bacterium]
MTSKPKSGVFYGWIIAAASSVILLLVWGFQYSYGIFFTELCDDLNWSRTMVSGAYSLFIGWHGINYLFAGKLNDKYGPRLTVAICIIALGAGYALMSTVDETWQLYVFYGIIIGTGSGFAFVPLTSTVSRWFIEKRGAAMGIAVAGSGIGVLALTPFSQFLISKFDWRTSYLIIAGLLFAIGLPISRLMRRDPSEKGLLPYGMREIGKEVNHNNPSSVTVDFTFKQATRTRAFWLLCVIFALLGFTLQMVMVHLKAYATDVGITPMVAATVIGIIGGINTLGRLTMGGISDRIGRKASFFIACILMAVMMLWLLNAREPWQFYLFSVIFGFGYGTYIPLFPAIAADWFGTKFHGTIFGTITLAACVGGAIGPVLAGYVFDTTRSYDTAIIMGAVTCFIAAASSFALKKPYLKEQD